jgi:hypothetical protein
MAIRTVLISAVVALAIAASACGETPMAGGDQSASAPPNFPTGTLGGSQFWSDELVLRGWRIQQNALTGHYRLLDDKDFRRAWGTYDECTAALDDLKTREKLPPVEGRTLIALHGLFRSRDQMEGIGQYLAEQGDYSLINVGYASTRRSLDDHAQSLAR